jgi:hypothetical protein
LFVADTSLRQSLRVCQCCLSLFLFVPLCVTSCPL